MWHIMWVSVVCTHCEVTDGKGAFCIRSAHYPHHHPSVDRLLACSPPPARASGWLAKVAQTLSISADIRLAVLDTDAINITATTAGSAGHPGAVVLARGASGARGSGVAFGGWYSASSVCTCRKGGGDYARCCTQRSKQLVAQQNPAGSIGIHAGVWALG
jgi:hypothetical protein